MDVTIAGRPDEGRSPAPRRASGGRFLSPL